MDSQIENEKLNAILRRAEEDAENAKSGAKVSALDPDFIFILIFVAIPFDFVFFILGIFDAFVVPWVIGAFLSFIPLAIIGLWQYSRSSKLSRTKENAEKKLNQIKEKISQHKKASQAVTKKITKQVGEKVVKQAGKQAVAAGSKAVAKVAAKTGFKIILRGGASLIGTNIPFIGGLIPFYTIWVLSTLKDK